MLFVYFYDILWLSIQATVAEAMMYSNNCYTATVSDWVVIII